jgi:ArsR family transcriptional regulator
MLGLLDIFQAVADPTRLRIIALLRTMELAVGELVLVLEQSQPRVSRHVRILAEAGLVERRREGAWVFLRLAQHSMVDQLVAVMTAWPLAPDERALAAADLARLDRVRGEREEAARRFFADHAAEWDAIRALHVGEDRVEAAMLALMRNRRLGHLLDIGTGTGRMAEIFAPAAGKITALDRSPEMLRIARTKFADRKIGAELVQADFQALPLTDASVDTIVMHQVLHFAPEPGQVIAEAARVLRPGGHLLIADFAPHDQEELRTKAAHARLGFSDGQMRGWFASAGLLAESTEALAGERLTVKLWLARRRSDDGRAAEPRNTAHTKRIAA